MSWQISGVSRAPTLFQIAGAPSAAYSLRQLDLVDQNVIRVRRSSDNTEADFTATQVSDGTLTTWVGAGNDGFVRTWYDQSGNGSHAQQSGGTSQPKVVNAGSLVTENNNPALLFDGSNDYFVCSSTLLGSATGTTTLAVCNFQSASAFEMLFTFSNASSNGPFEIRRVGGGNQLQITLNQNALTLSPAIDNMQILVAAYGEPSTFYASINNNAFQSAAYSSYPLVPSSSCQIGARVGGYFFGGTMQEILISKSSFFSSHSLLGSNINAHYNIF